MEFIVQNVSTMEFIVENIPQWNALDTRRVSLKFPSEFIIRPILLAILPSYRIKHFR